MCAAIHAVTNGLISILCIQTLMYTQPFAVYMTNTDESICDRMSADWKRIFEIIQMMSEDYMKHLYGDEWREE